MKKTLSLICVSACLFTLSGCKDATAQVSDSSKALITIGDTKITRGNVFNMMKKSDTSGSATLALVKEKIYEKENITLTDEMKKEATSKVSEMQTSLKYDDDKFLDYLKNMGFSSKENYIEQGSYPTLKEKALVEKYVNDKKQSILSTYTPIKAQIMTIGNEDNAKKALKAIQDGEDFIKTAEKYENSNSDGGKETIYYSESSIPSDIFTKMVDAKKGIMNSVMKDSTNSVYYVVNIVNNDTSEYEQEALDKIASDASSSSSSINTTIWSYYLKEHNFTIYDIDVYNGIKSSYESYIVQD